MKGLEFRQLSTNSKPHVESAHSISGSGAGISAIGTGCPSKPLKGKLPWACDMRCMVPSLSPNAMYAPVGDIALEVTYEVSSYRMSFIY